MSLIDVKVKDELEKIGAQIKEIAPDLNGQIIFNCIPQNPEPKVTVTQMDVTRVKN